MKKINIVGNSGSGKTRLALILEKKLKIPAFHLDALFWKDDWQLIPKNEQKKITKNLIYGTHWIIEGNYRNTLELRFDNCDTIILLDKPALYCLAKVFLRTLNALGKNRENLPESCKERLWNLNLYRHILGFKAKYKNVIYKKINSLENEVSIIVLKSNRDIKNYIKNLNYENIS